MKQPSRKRIQNNDSEDDPGYQEKNGDKDWEDPRNGLYSPWNSPGQKTGVGSFSLLQGMFLTQERTYSQEYSTQQDSPSDLMEKSKVFQTSKS